VVALGSAVVVTLVLTLGILSLTFPGFHLPTDGAYSLNLKEWVRGLAALVLLFDIYTVYKQRQLQRIRRKTGRARTSLSIDYGKCRRHDCRNRPQWTAPLQQSRISEDSRLRSRELAATSSMDQIHPDDRARVLEASAKAGKTGRGERLEYRIRHKDGSWRFLESTASAIRGPEGETSGLVIVNRDITERRRAEEKLAHQSFHDGLTDLPNRALFLDRLQRTVTLSRRHTDFKFAVLFIDIDEFKVSTTVWDMTPEMPCSSRLRAA